MANITDTCCLKPVQYFKQVFVQEHLNAELCRAFRQPLFNI